VKTFVKPSTINLPRIFKEPKTTSPRPSNLLIVSMEKLGRTAEVEVLKKEMSRLVGDTKQK
jgi:hypothetical protein